MANAAREASPGMRNRMEDEVRVRATITIEFETPDCLTLAAARGRLLRLADAIPEEFGPAALTITERRPRLGARALAPPVLSRDMEIVRARFAR